MQPWIDLFEHQKNAVWQLQLSLTLGVVGMPVRLVQLSLCAKTALTLFKRVALALFKQRALAQWLSETTCLDGMLESYDSTDAALVQSTE